MCDLRINYNKIFHLLHPLFALLCLQRPGTQVGGLGILFGGPIDCQCHLVKPDPETEHFRQVACRGGQLVNMVWTVVSTNKSIVIGLMCNSDWTRATALYL